MPTAEEQSVHHFADDTVLVEFFDRDDGWLAFIPIPQEQFFADPPGVVEQCWPRVRKWYDKRHEDLSRYTY